MVAVVDVAGKLAAQKIFLGGDALVVGPAHQARDERDDGRTAGGERESGPGQQGTRVAGVTDEPVRAGFDDAVLCALGEATLDPAVQHHVVAALAADTAGEGGYAQAPELPDGLTPREAEVLELIAEGLSNLEIAQRLVVSPTTVKSHINHLFAKAGLRDRAQAVNYAYPIGVATPPQ